MNKSFLLKIKSVILAAVLLIGIAPVTENVYALSDEEAVKADADAIAVGNVLDDNLILPSLGANGSTIIWSDTKGYITADGKYTPPVSDTPGATTTVLTATVTKGNTTETRVFKDRYAYFTDDYRIDNFIYEKNGIQSLYPEAESVLVGANVYKNPRVADALLINGIYENGAYTKAGYGSVTGEGIVPFNIGLGASIDNVEQKTFLWNNLSSLKPLAETNNVKLADVMPSKASDSFSAYADNGESAFAVIDGDTATSYKFSKKPSYNDLKKCLHIKQPTASVSRSQTAEYAFDEALTGNITFQYNFLITDTTGEKGIFCLYDSSSKPVLSVLALGNKLTNNGQKYTIEADLKAYKWYTLTAEVDTDKKQTVVKLDGEEKATIPFRQETTDNNIKKLQLYNAAGVVSEIYADDFSVIHGENAIFNENFDSYDVGTEAIDGWHFAKQGDGSVKIAEYNNASLSIFPQSIEVDLGRIRRFKGVSVTFPQGFTVKYRLEMSNSKSNYVRIASHMDEAVSGTAEENFDTISARYIRLNIAYAEYMGDLVNCGVSEISVDLADDEITENVAPKAHVAVTSNYSSAGNEYVYDASGLTDGIVAGYSQRGEWLARFESNPTIYFSWDEPQTIDSIIVYGRTGDNTSVSSATVTFPDGTGATINNIPKSGVPASVRFSPKTVGWLKIKLYGAESTNIGLSEVQILSSEGSSTAIEYREPWKVIPMPADYSGDWVVSDDIDGDGEVEFVSAKSYSEGDNHEISDACAFDLQGNELWHWSKGDVEGTTSLGFDLPCQIYDIDNDGSKEVLLATRTHLIILDAVTGVEQARFSLPAATNSDEWSSDCITIADIKGDGYADDIIVKTRYTEVWAYESPSAWQTSNDWSLIWSTYKPNDMNAAHHPMVVDIDSDGKDEVVVGYAIMDDDGQLISKIDKTTLESPIDKKHIDSIAVINFAKNMALEDMRFAISPCEARNFFVVDGNGTVIYEVKSGIHYETLLTGNFTSSELQILGTNVSSASDEIGGAGFEAIHFYYGKNGGKCEQYRRFNTNRYIHVLNMNNGIRDWIYSPADNVVIDGNGRDRIRLVSSHNNHITSMRWSAYEGYHNDMDGDGTADIVGISNRNGQLYINIYANTGGKVTASKLGTGYNYTLY